MSKTNTKPIAVVLELPQAEAELVASVMFRHVNFSEYDNSGNRLEASVLASEIDEALKKVGVSDTAFRSEPYKGLAKYVRNTPYGVGGV